MVSGIKNFFLTFLLAAVLFGLVAAAILGIVIDNINGVIAPEQEVTSSAIDDPDNPDSPTILTGSRYSVLVIGSDYRDGVYADYDAAQLLSLFGVQKKTYGEPMAPSDLMVPSAKQARKIVSDKDVEKDTVSVTEDGQLVIDGGFYTVKTRSVEADVAVVVTFDFEKMAVEYVPISLEKEIDVKGGKLKLSEFLGKYGIATFVEAVRSTNDVPIDRYLFIAARDFPAFFDTFGPVTYTLPVDLQGDDYMRDVHVSLTAGTQTFDGKKALDLLLFESYDSPVFSRQNTTSEFIRAFLGNAFSSAHAKDAANKARQVRNLVNTNIKAEEIEANLSKFAACASLGN